MIRILQHGCLPLRCQIWTDMFQQVREVDMDDTHTLHRPIRTHSHLPTSPASLLQTGGRLLAYPVFEPGRKVEKCAPQWRCSQSCSCPKPAAICLLREQRAKGQSFYSTFTHSSTINSKANNLLSFSVLPEIPVHTATLTSFI